MLTQRYLKSILNYDHVTGVFTWKVRASNSIHVGDVAGCFKQKDEPYVVIKINRKRYKAHRLAWFYMKGEWPFMVDHEDRNKSNNIWKNLRVSDSSKNGLNQQEGRGIYLYRGIWRARIAIKGKTVQLGEFADRSKAEVARRAAEKVYNRMTYG